MKLLAIALSAWLTLVLTGGAAPSRITVPGRTVATAYFEALIAGDVDRANSLVTAPFSFDRKEILRTREEIAAKHESILSHKGKRPIPAYEVSVPDTAVALDRAVFPAYEVFRITLQNDDQQVDIYVTTGPAPKVIGFSD